MRFFEKAMQDNDIPEKVTMDKNDTNTSGSDQIIGDKAISVIVRQIKHFNNIVEQDHRAVKRITKPMFGFKSFHSVKNILAGIELMHMICKSQTTRKTAKRCLLQTNFMRWQDNSVQRKCKNHFFYKLVF